MRIKYLNTIINFIVRSIPIHIVNCLTALLPNHMFINRLRGTLIRPFLGSCGKRLQIGRGVIINCPESLYLGKDCYISHYCYIQAKGKISMSDNVIIGPMSIISSCDHAVENGIVQNKGINKPIYIGEGTWCGGHVIVTSGVKIGESSVIGAGAVVTKDIPSNSKAVGIPAKPILKNR